MGGSREGAGGPTPPPPPQHTHTPERSQVAILAWPYKSGTDPLEKQLDPSGPIAFRGRSVQPFVKHGGD